MGSDEEAARLSLRAIDIYSKTAVDGDHDMADELMDLASAYVAMGQTGKALERQ